MKRLTRAVVTIGSFVIATAAAWGYPFGPPNGVTSAPGDRPGVACSGCHRGTAVNGGGGNVKVTFPNGLSYTPGQTQNLMISIVDGVAATYGFEMTARLESAPSTAQAGSFTAGTGQRIICSDGQPQPSAGCGGNGIQWIEHSQPSLGNTIAVQWTAPVAGAGNVHLYVAANATNGDNTMLNDHIYTADYVLTQVAAAGAVVPAITSVGGLGGAAGSIESGSWVTVTGTNFAKASATWDNSIITNVYPTTLGGVTVSINGKPAPISFVNATQITLLAPADSTLGAVPLVVSNANGSSAPTMVQLAAANPAFLTYSQNQGRYISAVVLDSSGFEYLAPQGLLDSSLQSRAAKPGDTVFLYGTGFGPTTTPLNPEIAQSVAYPLAHTGADITATVSTITIGGQAAQVQFIGIVSPGVYQANVVVPQVSAGDQPVTLKLLSGPSVTQQVFIPVQ